MLERLFATPESCDTSRVDEDLIVTLGCDEEMAEKKEKLLGLYTIGVQ